MSFFALGVNHKTASVSLREKLAFDTQRLAQFYDALKAAAFSQVVVLSTCNRTEVYALTESVAPLLDNLAAFTGCDAAQLREHSYILQDTEALAHAVRVGSGLDSMIVGEPQILGQLKQAVQYAQEHNMLSTKLGWVFEQVFSATKKVRSESKVGEQAVSLGFAVAKLMAQIFDDQSKQVLLLVAAGEMNQLVARHLCRHGVRQVIICNRSLARAEALADTLQAEFDIAVTCNTLDALPSLLPNGDIVCSCTGSLDVLIDLSMMKAAMKIRRYKPMLVVDLAIPRDIDSRVNRLDSVFHYAIDDLQTVIDANVSSRQQASLLAESIIVERVADITKRQRINDVGHDISQLQLYIQQTQQRVLEKALDQLAKGQPAEKVVKELSHQLTAKLTHGQFALMRDVASTSDKAVFAMVRQHLIQEPKS